MITEEFHVGNMLQSQLFTFFVFSVIIAAQMDRLILTLDGSSK
jgi:hypothetical protein